MTTTQPTTPTPPARNAPEDYTIKRLKALALGAGALVVVYAGWWLWRKVDTAAVMVPVIVVAAAMFAAAGFLWEYSSRAIGRDLPRQGKPQPVNASPPPIYFMQRMDVAGKTIDRDPQPVDFGVSPSDLDAALRYLKRGGKTSRAAMCEAIGISQGQWARLMQGLETTGVVRNNGRAGIDILGGVDAMLADLEAQLERW